MLYFYLKFCNIFVAHFFIFIFIFIFLD